VSRALQLGLDKALPLIEEVSEYASKEFSLERALDKMQGDWGGVVLEAMDWRSTGTTILRGLDDVQMLLDDQATKTQVRPQQRMRPLPTPQPIQTFT
jgi:dynein heavy chain